MGAELTDDAIDRLVRHVDEGKTLAVVGPTASGKTELACRLAAKVSGEVVSADSVQVYRRFDLGSGKPTPEELAVAQHHLVSVVDPHEPMDAARFVAMATEAIEGLRARGRVPIVCGGTFLWVKALIYGLAEAPPADPEVRARHRALVEASGPAELHRRLSVVDPTTAARLHPNDVLRVGRALEVFELTGRTMSSVQGDHAFRRARFPVHLVGRRFSADELTARISGRVGAWLEAGWIDEVASLVRDGYGDARAMGSVGYHEVKAHLDGVVSRDDLATVIVRATRIFARRQRTWLGHVDVDWLGA